MRRADRLFRIVLLLGRKRAVAARELAQTLEVSEPTAAAFHRRFDVICSALPMLCKIRKTVPDFPPGRGMHHASGGHDKRFLENQQTEGHTVVPAMSLHVAFPHHPPYSFTSPSMSLDAITIVWHSAPYEGETSIP